MAAMAESADVPIAGKFDPQFAGVGEAFRRNMMSETAAGREVGACVSVVVDGKTVVDLWGGYQDSARTLPWKRDTITCMLSVSKASASICALILADRGQLDLEQPVVHYWPEFAQAGKEIRTRLNYGSKPHNGPTYVFVGLIYDLIHGRQFRSDPTRFAQIQPALHGFHF